VLFYSGFNQCCHGVGPSLGNCPLPLSFPQVNRWLNRAPLCAPHSGSGDISYGFNLEQRLGWFAFRFVGYKLAYTQLGIIIAITFITIPFVVRTVQPVLEQLSPDYEEAGLILGGSRLRIFFQIIFPEILPALLTGFSLAFARGLGEYGSVIFIAGNKPFQTEIAPLIIMIKLEQFNYDQATAIALLMLAASFIIMFLVNRVQVKAATYAGEK
jgi:sulfate transport system permease protein